jgi:hypothetical protein
MPLAICSNCRHYRMRPQAVLFNQYELQSPGVLEAKLRWEQEQREQRLNEQRDYDENLYFDYEPLFYPWCAALTPYDPRLPETLDEIAAGENSEKLLEILQKSIELGHRLMDQATTGDRAAAEELVMAGRASMNPTNGEVVPFHALCGRMNPEGQCMVYGPKDAS